jgi:hypothetical protein
MPATLGARLMAKVALGQNIARALARYRNPDLWTILALHARAFRLHWWKARPPAAPPARAERVVVTLSTIPARAHRIGPALASLLDQTVAPDRIILCLPRRARLSGQPYPPPEALNLPPGIDILPCADEGPATKLLPTLKAEPQARIVVVDDDVIYPRDFIERLLVAHRAQPGVALGLRGVGLKPGVAFPALDHILCSAIAAPVSVDILFGTWGYLLPPGALDGAVHDFAQAPEALRWVDDVWISGHLARRGVRRVVVPMQSFPVETLASSIAALTDGPNRTGQNDAAAIAAFAADWPPRG